MTTKKFTGYVYVVRNGNGHEFLLPATFATTRGKAKERLQNLNYRMAEQRRPFFTALELTKVEVNVLEVIREYEVKPS